MEFADCKKCYPTHEELEAWIEGIHKEAEAATLETEISGDFPLGMVRAFHSSARIVKFTVNQTHAFWGIWIPKETGSPAPLLVHVPGYGAELSCHPDVAGAGYNVLLLSPLGYWTPNGFDDTLRMENGNWPVLPNTAEGKKGGYRDWLLDAVIAVNWAKTQATVQDSGVSFYGTSQGGGTALLLGSLFAGRGTRCVAADEPFLTNYPKAGLRGAYGVLADAIKSTDEKEYYHNLGFADTLTHAYRMNYPVLLTGGGNDNVCPPDTVESLFERLPKTKSYTFLHDHPHGYNQRFVTLALSWFGLFA